MGCSQLSTEHVAMPNSIKRSVTYVRCQRGDAVRLRCRPSAQPVFDDCSDTWAEILKFLSDRLKRLVGFTLLVGDGGAVRVEHDGLDVHPQTSARSSIMSSASSIAAWILALTSVSNTRCFFAFRNRTASRSSS